MLPRALASSESNNGTVAAGSDVKQIPASSSQAEHLKEDSLKFLLLFDGRILRIKDLGSLPVMDFVAASSRMTLRLTKSQRDNLINQLAPAARANPASPMSLQMVHCKWIRPSRFSCRSCPRPRTNFAIAQWEAALSGHPDRLRVELLLDGLEHGFNLGFDGTRSMPQMAKNLPSALEHKSVMTSQIAKETAASWLWQMKRQPCDNAMCSPIGMVSKRYQKLRRITHFSWPKGRSVNDQSEAMAVSYGRMDKVLLAMLAVGSGGYLWTFDIDHAFRNLAVRDADLTSAMLLLDGTVLCGHRLCFGFRNSPAIWANAADLLLWIPDCACKSATTLRVRR